MRIHTPKLKAPHPLAVLVVCLLWPAAAMIGAAISSESSAQAATAVAPTQHSDSMPKSPHSASSKKP